MFDLYFLFESVRSRDFRFTKRIENVLYYCTVCTVYNMRSVFFKGLRFRVDYTKIIRWHVSSVYFGRVFQ